MTHADGLLDAPAGWLDRSARRFDTVTDADLDAAAAHLAAAVKKARALVAGPGMAEESSRWSPKPAPAGRAGRDRVATTLDSGARLHAQRNDDSQVFALHLALHPRAVSEPAGKEGIASFLHRLFGRGTAFSDSAALSSRLGRLGASLKTDDDARVPFDDYYTTPEFSFIRLEMPAEAWREGVALVGEILRFPRLFPDDVEAVRKEMLDLQARRGASSRSRAIDTAERLLAPGHAITKPVLGTAESLAAITVDDLKAFHRDYVSGKRLVATVVAPVDAAEVVEALRAAFGDLPPGPDLPAARPVPDTPAAPGEQRAAAPKEQATIVMSYIFEAPEAERPALAVAGAMLSDALSFELREKRGLAYAMGASIAPWGGKQRLLVTMGTRKENLDEAIQGLKDGIAAFAPADDAAVARAAAAMRGRLLMRRLTRVNQAYFAGLEIVEGRAPGDDLKRLDALLTLDAAKVSAAAKRHLDAARLLVVVE
jgi:predicted Zn-dependent peptidase